MRKLMLLLLPLIAIACSKEEEKEPDYISLDKQSLALYYGEEKSVLVSTNVEYFSAESEDEYFADAIANISTIDVYANKVGKTKIKVMAGEASAELEVEVKTTDDRIGDPVVAIGKDAAYIKANETAKYLGDANGSGDLFYSDSEVPFGANHAYRFKSGKLSYILTTIGISKLNSSYDTYLIQLSNSLKEKYDYISSVQGKYQLIYMYQFKNGEYYIGTRKGSGNGGWYVCYAKTQDEVMNILDEHPSVAL